MELFQEEKKSTWLRWSSPKRKEDNWWNLSQGGDCWEIVSNSNYNLESQLGSLVEEEEIILDFLCVEGMTIPWCESKVYFLLKK